MKNEGTAWPVVLAGLQRRLTGDVSRNPRQSTV